MELEKRAAQLDLAAAKLKKGVKLELRKQVQNKISFKTKKNSFGLI